MVEVVAVYVGIHSEQSPHDSSYRIPEVPRKRYTYAGSKITSDIQSAITHQFCLGTHWDHQATPGPSSSMRRRILGPLAWLAVYTSHHLPRDIRIYHELLSKPHVRRGWLGGSPWTSGHNWALHARTLVTGQMVNDEGPTVPLGECKIR